MEDFGLGRDFQLKMAEFDKQRQEKQAKLASESVFHQGATGAAEFKVPTVPPGISTRLVATSHASK